MKAFGAWQRRGAVRGIVQVSESIQSGFLGPITLALQQWDANGDLVRGSHFEIVFERDEAAPRRVRARPGSADAVVRSTRRTRGRSRSGLRRAERASGCAPWLRGARAGGGGVV
jgi:hypothetical protein